MIDPVYPVGALGAVLIVLGLLYAPLLLAVTYVVGIGVGLGAWWWMHTWSERH